MKKLLSLLLGACTIFTACTNEDDGNLATDNTQALGVKVIVNPTSRTMVTGTSLPDGHSIGVNVTMPDGTNYDGKAEGYLNMKYIATGNMPGQTWEATPAIMLSGTQGVACAYYPWTDGTDYKAIQIKAQDQIDWMWAADAANNKVSDADNEVNFVFNHAQTAVNVVVARAESYTGAGIVADLAVESDGLASAATLDASTGTFVDGTVTGAGTAIAIAQQFTLDGTTKAQQENPFMLVPVDGQTEAFTISATIDGKPYSVAAVMPNNFTGYLAGKVYTINVAVQNTGLVVKGVTIVNDWEVIYLGDAQFKPEVTPTTPSGPVINSADKENGVYVVTVAGELVDYTTIDDTAIGVALITDNQRIMIEKYGEGEQNKDIIKAAYDTDGATNTEYENFYWGPVDTDILDINNIYNENSARQDFSGKVKTAAIITTQDIDSYTECANMGTYCKLFNEMSGIYADWYIPAAGQLYEVYKNRTNINAALANISGTIFNGESYWSSTEKDSGTAWFWGFGYGGAVNHGKYYNFARVRFVRDIN